MGSFANDGLAQTVELSRLLVEDHHTLGASDEQQTGGMIDAHQVWATCQAHRRWVSRDHGHRGQTDAQQVLEKPTLWVEVRTGDKRDVLVRIDIYAVRCAAIRGEDNALIDLQGHGVNRL
jgi:hypothetical protein